MLRLRSTAAAIATAALAAGTLSVTAIPSAAGATRDQPVAAATAADKLGAHDRALLAKYAKQHRARTVLPGAERAVPGFATLLMAVKEGRTAQAKQALTELGADVSRTEAPIGYIKANVPFADVDKVVAVDDVIAVDVDELIALEDVRPDGDAAPGPLAAPSDALPKAPSAATPDSNAYMPTRETGSVKFKDDNPRYDGRGVTIGIMDSGVDPTHPALAKTTTGERKLVDSVTGTDPNDFMDMLFDNTWQIMTKKVSGPDYTDTFTDTQWKLPDESGLRFSYRKNGVTGAGDAKIGVLARESDDTVWVDTDEDFDFTDEEALRPYAEKQQVAYVGEDDPATAISERYPFTVQVKRDVAGGYGVNLGFISEAHGTHVAGITAAHGMYGGKMDGQAPGAKLVSMRACHSLGCSSAALTDGMIDLATKHDVDVINMSIGSSPAMNDGQSARSLLYNRLIDESGVQLFISAGNSGAGTNTVGDPTGADKVVSVGAAVSGDTWWANYGSEVKFKEDIFPFSSRGPREDGGFKPDITAPGAAVSTTPGWIAPASVPETGYVLPVGYSMMNGTSMSSPQAAGAAALLLSAAGQKKVSATPAELRSAISTGADYNNKVDAIAQGRGQFDVRKAWSVLSKGAGAGDGITVSAPVCTVLSDTLVTPHTGSGLFNSCAPGSGGQSIGESRAYDLTVTRTGGKDGALPYEIGLKGNDGTFSVPDSVKFQKNVPTVVKVTAEPGKQGTHSAVLTFDNPDTRAADHSALLAVEAATPLAADKTWKVTGTTYRNKTVHYTVAVPAGTKSLSVNMAGLADKSQTRWWAFRPDGTSGEAFGPGSLSCFSNYLDGNGCAPEARTYNAPTAGVWEIVVESRRSTPQWSNPFQLEATVTR